MPAQPLVTLTIIEIGTVLLDLWAWCEAKQILISHVPPYAIVLVWFVYICASKRLGAFAHGADGELAFRVSSSESDAPTKTNAAEAANWSRCLYVVQWWYGSL